VVTMTKTMIINIVLSGIKIIISMIKRGADKLLAFPILPTFILIIL
jgi:hypothetical protein